MRDGSLSRGRRRPLVKAARSLTLAVASCCGFGVTAASAQQPYPVVNTSATVPADDLQARLEQQETEIQQLHAQLTGLAAAESNKAAEAAPCDGNCKEVPIIEKPTFVIGGNIYWDDASIQQSAANVTATQRAAEHNWTGFSLL